MSTPKNIVDTEDIDNERMLVHDNIEEIDEVLEEEEDD